MPTTSGELARACLAGLRDAGAKFAVLHDYEQLESDRMSDVDIVVGQDPRTVIRATESMWRERGLLPIILWPYDIGGTATLFLATPDARDGVQLDMLHDPVWHRKVRGSERHPAPIRRGKADCPRGGKCGAAYLPMAEEDCQEPDRQTRFIAPRSDRD